MRRGQVASLAEQLVLDLVDVVLEARYDRQVLVDDVVHTA